MTVAEFIVWLQTQPQDDEVRVLQSAPATGWEGGESTSWVNFNPIVHVDITDDRVEKRFHPKSSFHGRCVLDYGSR